MTENKDNRRQKINNKTDTRVIVSFPDSININMVQSNELKHYELFVWLVTILAPIAAGFLIAYLTDDTKNNGLLASTVTFTLITGLFILLAIHYRKKLFHGSIEKEMLLRNFK